MVYVNLIFVFLITFVIALWALEISKRPILNDQWAMIIDQ